MEEPIWATELIKGVLAAEKRTRRPVIEWKHSSHYSSGVCHRSSSAKARSWHWHGKRCQTTDITIRLGKGTGHDHPGRALLLHELSHWLIRPGHRHDMVFWRKTWGLYSHFLSATDFTRMMHSEFNYMKKAEVCFNQMFG